MKNTKNTQKLDHRLSLYRNDAPPAPLLGPSFSEEGLPPGRHLGQFVAAIDPGFTGALLVTNGGAEIESILMPVKSYGDKEKRIDFFGVKTWLEKALKKYPISTLFLERAYAGGMGVTSAFNYGRGFESLLLVVESLSIPFILVEPQKWTKEMHEGFSKDLKAKAKSLLAAERLYPHLVPKLPTRPKGGLHEGPIDALLIAGYGLRKLGHIPPEPATADFY